MSNLAMLKNEIGEYKSFKRNIDDKYSEQIKPIPKYLQDQARVQNRIETIYEKYSGKK